MFEYAGAEVRCARAATTDGYHDVGVVVHELGGWLVFSVSSRVVKHPNGVGVESFSELVEVVADDDATRENRDAGNGGRNKEDSGERLVAVSRLSRFRYCFFRVEPHSLSFACHVKSIIDAAVLTATSIIDIKRAK